MQKNILKYVSFKLAAFQRMTQCTFYENDTHIKSKHVANGQIILPKMLTNEL